MTLRSKKLLVLETIVQLERAVNLNSPTWLCSRLSGQVTLYARQGIS